MNYLAIIISTVYAMVLGSAWYSLIFGKLWMRSLGWSEKVIEKQKKMANMPLTLGLMALSALVTLLVLAALGTPALGGGQRHSHLDSWH